ncbi:MAG: efflux RND transporter periplasmic adaptor subunit [Bacteroidetes bacterium]|nr:efflux RND transporter periplasmic adaptor subunit [Bacteroidota bacterium]
MKKTNRILLILGILTVALVIVGLIGKQQGWFGGTKAIKVTAEKISKRNIVQTVTANGKIYPEIEVKISSDVSGEIVELYFEEGDPIKRGDLIARIKPDSYNNAVAQVQANYQSSLANLESAKATVAQAENSYANAKSYYDKLLSSYEKGNVKQVDLENAENAMLSAESQVEAAKQNVTSLQYASEALKATITDARTNLGKTAIFSPLTGIVSSMNVEKGEKVVGTLQMTGTEMLRVADFENMEVRVNVSENDIIRVHLGDTSIIEVDAYPDDKFKGIVTSIASSSNGLSSNLSLSSSQSTNFEVKINILKSSYEEITKDKKFPFLPGMSATADIQTKRVTDVISVPLQAVGTRDTNEDSVGLEEKLIEVVFIEDNGVVKRQTVKTGIQNDTYIEVLEGLEVGQTAITAPYNAISKDLEDGDPVEIVSKKELYGLDKKKGK